MRAPSSPVLRTRPCPFGRPVRLGFPHRLRPGTSPHALRIPPHGGHPALRSTASNGSRSALAVSSFRLRDCITMPTPLDPGRLWLLDDHRLGRKESDMMTIGVDYHPSFQQMAFLIEEIGECDERELKHSDGEAERFYRDLHQRGIRVRVGMEATGYSRWFERLLAELDFELWIGDPAEIEAKRVKKRKTDREDARLLLRLMREDRFPQIWVPSPENRDLRQLLWHRHRLVQMRTRIMNQLQALAMNEGKRWKSKLFSQKGRAEFEKLVLGPWASRRRSELLELLDRLNPSIEELTTAVQQEVNKRPE